MPKLRMIFWLVGVAVGGLTTQVRADDAPAVTFNRDVAPILFANCAGCHRPGEVAPFALLSYRDAAKRAELIAEVTTKREMPPWKVEPGSGHFADERRLSDEQVAMIRRWADTGATEGDATDLPATPEFTTGWQLGEPDLVVRMTEPYTLTASGPDEYRCFVLPVEIPAGKYIKSIEYRPSNRKVVHHAVLTSMPHEQAAAKLAAGDGKSFLSGLAPPGRLLSGPLSIWTPGMIPHLLPADLTSSWPSKADMVLQLHLHPSGMPEVEQSVVGIHLTDKKPAARLAMNAFSNNRIDIPAGDANYERKTSRTFSAATTLFGVFPHMHLIGHSVTAVATLPDASKVPLITINDWDFNWQYYYQYAEPVQLPAGTVVDVRWTYDNSAANPTNPSSPPKRVTFGEETVDEMAFLIFDTIATGPAPVERVPSPEQMARRAASILKMLDKNEDGFVDEAEISASPMGQMGGGDLKKLIANVDKDGDGKLNAAELLETMKGLGRP